MHINRWLIFFSLLPLLSSGQAIGTNRLDDFTTDGCSQFPEGTNDHKNLWHQCCTEHDKKYWVGGSAEERMSADEALQACVQAVGKPEIAALMLAGVRVGGSPWWPTTFRWGYGWPYTNGYRELTRDEMELVRKQKIKQGLN